MPHGGNKRIIAPRMAILSSNYGCRWPKRTIRQSPRNDAEKPPCTVAAPRDARNRKKRAFSAASTCVGVPLEMAVVALEARGASLDLAMGLR